MIGADGLRSKVREELGIATEGAGRPRGAPCGPLPRAGLGPRRRAPLRHLLRHRRARGPQLPSRRRTRIAGCSAMHCDCAADDARGAQPRAGAGLDPRSCRRPRAADRDRAHDAGRIRGRAGRAIPRGRRVPDRRCRAPGDPAGRHRAQHGDPRRLRHRLEAGLGPARLGWRAAARQLRARAPAGGRVQHRSARPGPTARSSAPSSASTPTSAAASPTSGCRATAACVSTLDLLGDGLTLLVGPHLGRRPAASGDAARRR